MNIEAGKKYFIEFYSDTIEKLECIGINKLLNGIIVGYHMQQENGNVWTIKPESIKSARET